VTARGSLGWRHAFGDTSPTTAAAFGGSSAFEMTGTPVAKSVGVIEAGLDFKLSNTATLGVTYGGQFGLGPEGAQRARSASRRFLNSHGAAPASGIAWGRRGFYVFLTPSTSLQPSTNRTFYIPMPKLNPTSEAPSTLSSPHAVRRRFAPSVLVVALAGALAVPGTASAAGWLGVVSSDWFTAGNWSPSGVPGAATDVLINSSAANPTAINAGSALAKNVTVGDSVTGTGILSITNAGKLASTAGTVGARAGSTGTVTVSSAGSASVWTIANDLVVGQSGKGTLNINAGGKVSGSYAYLGANAGSTGTATVDGAGANWATSQALFVGFNGTGSLTVSNGGTTNSLYGLIGDLAGSTGTVVVKGPGSRWSNAADLQVGGEGAGSLAVLNQGEVKSGRASIGAFLGSTGTATVDGFGSLWAVNGDLVAGESGNGTLNVTAGGKVGSSYGYLGQQAGSSGTVAVNGAGSIWAVDQALFVGLGGTGALTVSNGGAVSSTYGLIGDFKGSTGTVLVQGPNSLWVNSADLQVGGEGSGSLAILNQGQVQSGSAAIGAFATSTGTATVDGSGSRWTVNGRPGDRPVRQRHPEHHQQRKSRRQLWLPWL
jgi:T5SS/PEP-CTERM-associated repeat protein